MTIHQKEEIKEHFEFFLQNIPNHLDIAKKWLKKEKLDFSLEEIDLMGKKYWDLFKKNKKIPGKWYDEAYEVYVTYIGEAFKNYFKGKWKINNTKGTLGYGYPFIFDAGPDEYKSNPYDPSRPLIAIENGDKEPMSVIFVRNINYYKHYPEWNFDPLENLKKNLEKENQ